MKKKIAVIAVICVIAVMLSISCFASYAGFLNGEAVPFFPNVGQGFTGFNRGSGPYGGIFMEFYDEDLMIQSMTAGLDDVGQLNYGIWSSDVYIKNNIDAVTGGDGTITISFYIPYNTNRYVIFDLKKYDQGIIQPVDDIVLAYDYELTTISANTTMTGFYYDYFLQQQHYTYTFTQNQKCIKVNVKLATSGHCNMHCELHFADDNLQAYIKDYDNLYDALDALYNQNHIAGITGYISEFFQINFVYLFVLCGILAIVFGIVKNWMETT